MSDAPLVLPTEIPWERLKGHDLEETIYWLLDALGARDLEWRRGGKGAGAADQGRDLQATFQVPTPEGEFRAQRWWIEAKGRKSSVERSAVQKAVSDAEVQSGVDVLVVVTNGSFTNPVRDWVNDWNAQHRRPEVKLWDRDTLERQLTRHPSVVARLFAKALSPHGHIAVLEDRFVNRGMFASSDTPQLLWKHRDELNYSAIAPFALVASEYANGDPYARRWMTLFIEEAVLSALALSNGNARHILARVEQTGGHNAIIKALAHLLVASLKCSSASDALMMFNAGMEVAEWPESFRDVLFSAQKKLVTYDFLSACAADCVRVSFEPQRDVGPEAYWDKFATPIAPGDADEPGSVLLLERNDRPCKVGFKVGDGHGCPLVRPPADQSEWFSAIGTVVKFRARSSSTIDRLKQKRLTRE